MNLKLSVLLIFTALAATHAILHMMQQHADLIVQEDCRLSVAHMNSNQTKASSRCIAGETV